MYYLYFFATVMSLMLSLASPSHAIMAKQTVEADEIEHFFHRIRARTEECATSPLPKELKGLILQEDVGEIYAFLTRNRSDIERKLKRSSPLFFSKNTYNLARTINIILKADTNEIMLILETKSKLVTADGSTQKHDIPVFSGTEKSTKASWRIDTVKPIKMANSVFYAVRKKYIRKDLNEQKEKNYIALQVALKAGELAPLIGISSLGCEKHGRGLRKMGKNNAPQKYYAKISLYSEYALGSLHHVLKNEHYYFSPKEIEQLSKTLLLSVQLLHDNENIHQDIKPDNILVYQKENGEYYLSLIDFGNTYDPLLAPNEPVLATLRFESPEISALYYREHDKKDFYHSYYHMSAQTDRSLGFKSFERIYGGELTPELEQEYLKPHKANDMWAVGVVLKKMNKTLGPKASAKINRATQGLLSDNREQRLTVAEALNLLK